MDDNSRTTVPGSTNKAAVVALALQAYWVHGNSNPVMHMLTGLCLYLNAGDGAVAMRNCSEVGTAFEGAWQLSVRSLGGVIVPMGIST